MTDNAVVIAALQCDYYHYAICYIGSVAVVVPLWLKHRFCVAVLPCKRGNSSVIYTHELSHTLRWSIANVALFIAKEDSVAPSVPILLTNIIPLLKPMTGLLTRQK